MNSKQNEDKARQRSAHRNGHKKLLFSESNKCEPLSSRHSAPQAMDYRGIDHRAGQDSLKRNHDYSHLLNQPRRGRKTSLVWNFFYINPLYICQATCNICLKSVRRGQRINQLGTSTLQRHLQYRHPLKWAEALQAKVHGGSKMSDEHSELHSSWTKIRELVPNDQGRLEECLAPHESSLCAPEFPHSSNRCATHQEPEPTYRTHLKKDPETQKDHSTFKGKQKEDLFKPMKMQSNEELYQHVAHDMEPLSTFPTGITLCEVEEYPLGYNKSLYSLQVPRKRAKRNESLVWKFFLVNPRRPSKATCAVCSRSISRGCPGTILGTSTLHQHLLSKHPVHWSMANKSSFESDLLENPLRFSVPPVKVEEPCVTYRETSTSFPSDEVMEVDSTAQKSNGQCVDKLPGDQESQPKENIKHELILINCVGEEELYRGTLNKKRRNYINKNPKPEPLLLSDCAADIDAVCVSRLLKQQLHWTSENIKLEPVDFLERAVKEQLCSLPRDQGHQTEENFKPEPVSLTNCSDEVGLSVGRLHSKQGHWTRENLTSEPASLSNIVDKRMVCVGRLPKKLTPQADDIAEKERVCLSDCAQAESDSFSCSHASTANCLDRGSDEESFLNKTYPVKSERISGKPSKRMKSPVWLFFSIDPLFPNLAVCNVCGKSVSRGRPGTPLGTSSLQRHLLAKHRTHWDRANQNVQEMETRVTKHPTCQLEIPILNRNGVSRINKGYNADCLISCA